MDSFYLSGACVLPAALVEDLSSARAQARELGEGVPIEFGDETFVVASGGLGRYAFRLDHRGGVVGVTTSNSLPALRIQPRATFLHGLGVTEALAWFCEVFEMVVGAVTWRASRVDLFMDSHGWDLGAEARANFICRGKQLVTYEDQADLTGFRFGAGSSAAVSARIYDKTVESRAKGSDWWPAKWGEAYRPGERVLRVEFQVGRGLIRQVGLSSPEDVLRELPSLWGYLTDEWLTYRTPTADTTRSRWPVAPEWLQVQRATLRGDAVGLDRVYAGEHDGSMRRLLPALRGYLASAGAHLGASTLDETLHRVERLLTVDEQQTGMPFVARLLQKRFELGIA
ncbi:MAG: hypothetical protein JWQ32_1157 [Marmoricola sp.]|nr:hypothetical protein [Marmoricola sp.]